MRLSLAAGLALLLMGVAAQAAPERLALIVGIDSYPDPEIHNLSGAVNDAKLWASTLKHRFGFKDSEVRLLLNGQATRAGIERAFHEHLVAKAGPKTAAVLIYSGHGSQQPGDEEDSFDETLVPCDSGRKGRPNKDITDDELNAWIAKLAAKTPNITVIRDSCHAGGSMRATARLAPAGQPAKAARVRVRAPAVDYVNVVAANSRQLAHERFFQGRRHGQFTWHLTQALLDTDSDAVSWADLMDRVRPQLDVEGSPTRQTPAVEGLRDDRKPFRLELLPRRRGFPATPTPDGVRIEAGRLFGFAKGSVFEVVGPRGGPAARAKVRLTTVDATLSSGEVIEGGPVVPGSRAYELERKVTAFQVPVHVPKKARFKTLRAQLEAQPQLRLVDDPVDADLAAVEAGGGFALRTPDPHQPKRYAPSTPGPATEKLLWWTRWLHLQRLRAPTRGPRVEFEWDARRGDRARLKDGTRFELAVVNRHDAPVFVWLLNLAPDGSIGRLYPPGGQPEPLRPGNRIAFPAVAEIEGGRPVSRETILALVTSEFTDFSFLSTPRDVATREAIKSPLQDLLGRTVRTRGVSAIEPLPVVDWNIVRWHLEVVP